jgi:hypothetical protein
MAKELILALLKDGPKPVKDIEVATESRCISGATLHRAADDLGVIKSGAKGRESTSIWELPRGREKQGD